MTDALLSLYVRGKNLGWRLGNKLTEKKDGAGLVEYTVIIGIAVVAGVALLSFLFYGDSNAEIGGTPNDNSGGLAGVFKAIVDKLAGIVGGGE